MCLSIGKGFPKRDSGKSGAGHEFSRWVISVLYAAVMLIAVVIFCGAYLVCALLGVPVRLLRNCICASGSDEAQREPRCLKFDGWLPDIVAVQVFGSFAAAVLPGLFGYVGSYAMLFSFALTQPAVVLLEEWGSATVQIQWGRTVGY